MVILEASGDFWNHGFQGVPDTGALGVFVENIRAGNSTHVHIERCGYLSTWFPRENEVLIEEGWLSGEALVWYAR